MRRSLFTAAAAAAATSRQVRGIGVAETGRRPTRDARAARRRRVSSSAHFAADKNIASAELTMRTAGYNDTNGDKATRIDLAGAVCMYVADRPAGGVGEVSSLYRHPCRTQGTEETAVRRVAELRFSGSARDIRQ